MIINFEGLIINIERVIINYEGLILTDLKDNACDEYVTDEGSTTCKYRAARKNREDMGCKKECVCGYQCESCVKIKKVYKG